MKKPKINVKLKMPEKKPTIKNRFLQKNLLSLIVIAVLAIGTGTAYGTLSSQDADRGNDPVNGVNQDRYQVLISGKGYKLSKKQEKDYKLQKKQNEANVNKAAQDNPNVIRSSSGSRIFRSGSSSYRYSGGSTYKVSKNPHLRSNISEQIDGLSDNVKAGDTLKFRVSAVAYPYGSKNVISKDNIKVTVEGGKEAKVYKEKSGYVYYEVELGQGDNIITISATDKKTKKTSKLGPFKIKKVGANSGSGGSTDPTHGTDPAATETAVTINLGIESLALQSNLIAITSSTKAKDILSNTDGIKMDGEDIEYIEFDTIPKDVDKELRESYKEEKGIEAIVEEDYNAWLVEKHVKVDNKYRLGEKCPFDSTNWTYDKNQSGEDLKSGITLTFTL